MTEKSRFDRASRVPNRDRDRVRPRSERRAESSTFIRISRGKFYLAYEGICEAIVPAEWVAQTIREHRENYGEGCEN